MTMIRRLSIVFILMTLLAACGGQPVAQNSTSVPVAEATSAPVATNAPVATSAPAVTTAPATSGFPLTITDGTGRKLTFDKPPERVVALYNDNFGMLATLGVEPVGVLANAEMLSDPIYFAGKGASFTQIKADETVDAESVAATRPDLILAYSPEEAQLLQSIAPVYLPGDAATVEDLYPALRRLATILDKLPQAEAAIQQFQDRYAAYQKASPKNAGTVLKLGYMDGGKFYVSTVDDPLCRMLAQVATCAWEKATLDEFWGYETSLEGVLTLDPDVIILNNWSESSRQEMLAALNDDPLWNELRAVQAQRVFGTENYENPIASSLPAAQKFLDTYMPLLYPAVFPKALTDEQVKEILAGKVGQSAAGGFPMTIKDGEGRELTFEKPPERFVCTYSRCIEVLAALEIEPVGVTTGEEPLITNPLYFSQPTKTEILPYDGDFPNLEKLAALKPDFVFGWQELGDALKGIAPVYNVVNGQDSYAESHDEIRMLAKLLGREEIAERNIMNTLNRLKAYKTQSPKNVSVMYGFFYQGAFSYRDGQSGTCNLLKEIALCDWPDPENRSSWSVEVGDEGLLKFDPDVLLIDSYGFDGKTNEQIIAEVSQRPLWAELKAVKNKRVYVSSDSIANMDGMGTIGMAAMLDVYGPLLYPDVFPQALTDEQVKEILGQ